MGFELQKFKGNYRKVGQGESLEEVKEKQGKIKKSLEEKQVKQVKLNKVELGLFEKSVKKTLMNSDKVQQK